MALLSWFPLLFAGSVCVLLVRAIITGLFANPLRSVPGPWYSRFTHLVLKFYIVTGQRIYYVDRLHRTYGSVVRIAPNEVVVSDLEGYAAIHRIGSGFLKSPWYDLVNGLETGIFGEQNPHKHAARRRLFAQAFSNSALQRNWSSDVHQKAQRAVERIKADAVAGEADILKWWTLMATDVIAHLAFGESFDMLELGKKTPYIEAVQQAVFAGVLRYEVPWIFKAAPYLPFEGLKRLASADNVVCEHGGLAVRNMKNQQSTNGNLFSQMVAAADDKDKVMITDSAVRIEAGNLIIAGSDTTAVTLTYLVWAVLKDPALQRDLEDEVANLSPGLGQDELKDAPLLNSVIEEALRIYGAAPGALPRVAPPEGATIGGYFLPGGTEVTTQAYTMHRDSSIFPDAHRFDGRRSLNNRTMTREQKIAFTPFGGGSRICIGLHLAWMELRIGTALFFRECRGARIGDSMTDDMMEMENHFLIAPKGHRCNITLRF